MKKKIKEIAKEIRSNPIYIYISLYITFLIISSIFRDATADETYYLRETMLISELLKGGIWIGDYGVGLHGFLFKIPVALTFLIIGRESVFVATFFTISLASTILILFYRLVKKHLGGKGYAFWSTILLSVVLHFIMMTVSFNRDIPALFTVLLFLTFFFQGASNWKIGLIFLLMLDAKEHFFLTTAPIFGVYIFLSQVWFVQRRGFWLKLKNLIIELFKTYSLSLIWIVLMFTTSIIPMNMFVASIGGQIDRGISWNTSQFKSTAATENLITEDKKEIPSILEMKPIVESCGKSLIYCNFFKSLNFISGYLGKILYPRTFSFISIPKIIVFPSIIVAISLLMKWFKQKDKRIILPLLLLFNVLILILRASHGRYLLCVAPIFALFFVIFVKDFIKRPLHFRNAGIGTTIFVILGLLFESSFLIPKIILEFSLLSLLWSIWFLRGNKRALHIAKNFLLSVISLGMLSTAIAFSYSIGQISTFIRYGYNRETDKIVSNIDKTETIWINDYGSGELINMYRKNLDIKVEWTWPLREVVPKKNLLKTLAENNTYSSLITGGEEFRNYLKENGIGTVVLIKSTLKTESFSDQDKLPLLLSQDWLLLEDTISLRNKRMYIFKVIIGN